MAELYLHQYLDRAIGIQMARPAAAAHVERLTLESPGWEEYFISVG